MVLAARGTEATRAATTVERAAAEAEVEEGTREVVLAGVMEVAVAAAVTVAAPQGVVRAVVVTAR